MSLQIMMGEEKFPTFDELMDSPLDNHISLAAKTCGYGGTTEELIVNYVHLLLFKAKSAASQEENPNWREATKGVFFDNY